MHWHQAVSRVARFVQFSFEISMKKPLIAKEKRKENGQKYQLYCRVLPSREINCLNVVIFCGSTWNVALRLHWSEDIDECIGIR